MVWIKVCIALVAHIVIHTALLLHVVPPFGAPDHGKADADYSETATRFPCSWFSGNLLHCLRSEYIYEHDPPFDMCVSGKTSDYAKAYKQVPVLPRLRHWRRLLQYSPKKCGPVWFEALSLLFGGSEDPQQFSRFPAWACYCLAVAFAVGSQHFLTT